ncbi:MAG TPA: hypothetical protein VEB63_12150 [Chitinophagaceae bacterium]|nr:hypothetical protein [Chitinophagaceae bacterium]
MKKTLILFSLWVCIAAFTAAAQPPVTIYAYSQATTPGMIPVDESGKPLDSRKERINYFIYAAFPDNYALKFDGIWIRGQGHRVQTHVVESTPVVITNNDIPAQPVKTVLVPATRRRVISIQPLSQSPITVRAAWFRDMTRRNELVVSYFYKGKKYFLPVRKFKVLPPVAAQ